MTSHLGIILLLNLTIIDILFLLFSTPPSLAVGYAGSSLSKGVQNFGAARCALSGSLG